jgi:putative membrane protein
MVTYNPKDWIKLILHFHKSDTMRILLPAILLLGCITGVVSFVEQKFLSHRLPPNLSVFHQISGFIISLVLVFRINTAYDRWWEGRKLWGSLINQSRNLALKLNAILPQEDLGARKELQTLISNYAFSLKEHLRGNSGENFLTYTTFFTREAYLNVAHKPNYIAKLLVQYLVNHYKMQKFSQADYLVLNQNVNELTDICGACERIRTTPIPYSYSIFIKKVIFIYVITMPFTFGLSVGYWSIFIVMMMFYAFASMELISEEIEDPFGADDNDLPTDEIADRIRINTNEILFP